MEPPVSVVVVQLFFISPCFLPVHGPRMDVLATSSPADYYCGKGERLVDEAGLQHCKPCPNNTFMSRTKHKNRICQTCSKAQSFIFERQIGPCTRERDTLIICKEGYFRVVFEDSMTFRPYCRLCGKCMNNTYEGRRCGGTLDTVCCPQPDMLVVDVDGNPECRFTRDNEESENRTLCKQGEYLDENDQKLSSVCKPCPQGTFMNESDHTRKSCWTCSAKPGFILQRKCNRTMDAVFTMTADSYSNAPVWIWIVLSVLAAFVTVIIIIIIYVCKVVSMSNRASNPEQGEESSTFLLHQKWRKMFKM